MPYVIRDPSGRVTEVHANKTERAQEELAPGHPALREFLAMETGTEVQDALNSSDLGLIRVIEDLVGVLIDKRIIALTDLPKAAQQKLARRYSLRSQLTDLQGIVAEPEEISLP